MFLPDNYFLISIQSFFSAIAGSRPKTVLNASLTRAKGKPLEEPCAICGEMRWTDVAHFPKRKRDGGGDEGTIFLCPTHHKLLDSGRISLKEMEALMNNEKFRGVASSTEEFVEWAHSQGYPYTLADLRKKFWD